MVQAAHSGKKNIPDQEICRRFVGTHPAEVIANIAICLIHQANELMDRQLRRLGKDFVEQGSPRERMMRIRLQHRKSR